MDMIDGHALLLRAARELGASIDILASSTRGTFSASKTLGSFAVRVFFVRAEGSLSKTIRALQILPVQVAIIPKVAIRTIVEAEAS